MSLDINIKGVSGPGNNKRVSFLPKEPKKGVLAQADTPSLDGDHGADFYRPPIKVMSAGCSTDIDSSQASSKAAKAPNDKNEATAIEVVDSVYDVEKTSLYKQEILAGIDKQEYNFVAKQMSELASNPTIKKELPAYIISHSKKWNNKTLLAIFLEAANVGHFSEINKIVIKEFLKRELANGEGQIIYRLFKATKGHIYYVNGYKELLLKAINEGELTKPMLQDIAEWKAGHLDKFAKAAWKQLSK